MGKLTSNHVKVSKVLTPDLERNQCYGSLSLGLIIKVKVNDGESESKSEQSADQEKQSVQWVSQPRLNYPR